MIISSCKPPVPFPLIPSPLNFLPPLETKNFQALNPHSGFLPRWTPGANLEREAEEWGTKARTLVQSGTNGRPLSAYVNYAHGDEPLEAVYGYEPWRLARLRKLKKRYDPDFKFRFYNPIR